MRTSVKCFAFAEETKKSGFWEKCKKWLRLTYPSTRRNNTVAANLWQNIPTISESCKIRGHGLRVTKVWEGDARSVIDTTSFEFYRLGTRQGVLNRQHARTPFTRRSKVLWDCRNISDKQLLNYRQAMDRDLKASHYEMFLCQQDNTRHFHTPVLHQCLHNT